MGGGKVIHHFDCVIALSDCVEATLVVDHYGVAFVHDLQEQKRVIGGIERTASWGILGRIH